MTQKVFLLHDLLLSPARLKSLETVVGLQDLDKKVKVFPFSSCTHTKTSDKYLHNSTVCQPWVLANAVGFIFRGMKSKGGEKVVVLAGNRG